MSKATKWVVPALASAFAATAIAGDVEIPVEDLTSATWRAPKPWPQPWPDPKMSHAYVPDDARRPFDAPFAPEREATPGEPAANGRPATPPTPAAPDELVTTIATLAGVRDFKLTADRRALRVPESAAAAVRAAVERIRAQIPDPILAVLRSGTHVAARVLPLPSGDEAVVASPQTAEPMHPAYSEMADIDRAVVDVERAALTLRAKSGEPTTTEWTGRDGRALRVTINARFAPTRPDSGTAAIFWSPVVGGHLPVWSHVPETLVPAKAEETDDRPLLGREGARWLLSESGPQRAAEASGAEVALWDQATGVLVFGGAGAGAARDALVAAIDADNRSVAVALDVWDAPRGAQAPSDGSTPQGAKEIARVQAPMRLDFNGVFVAAEARSYLQDWDVEVAQSSAIPDPVVSVLFAGSFANVRVRRGPNGAPAFVDLDLVTSRLVGMETQTIPVLVPTPVPSGPDVQVHLAGGKSGTATPPSSATATWFRASYSVEKPSMRESRIAVTLPLDADGRATMRRTLPGFLGAGREIVVVVRVK